MGSSNEKKSTIEAADLTLDNLESALASDTKIKLAGLDIDGVYSWWLTDQRTDFNRNPSW